MKKVFYHNKGVLNQTWAYETSDSVKQIKSDMVGNACVLDAIYYYESDKVVNYSKRMTDGEYCANL